MEQDIAFEMAASSIRFGWGVTREVGMDLVDCGAKRVMVVTDPVLRELPPVATVLTALEEAGVPHVLFDRVQIEPTDASFKEAIAFAVGEQVDAFVAVGGGSTIDTAKAANLYATYPADFLDYVNAPIGKGLPVPGAAQAVDRDSEPLPAPAARPPALPSSIWCRCTPKRASPTATSSPRLASSTPKTRPPCRQRQ